MPDDPFAQYGAAGANIKAPDPYTTKTANMTGMDQQFMDAFGQMAQDYLSQTGKSLVINDAFRSHEAQAKAYKDKPNLAAPPGHSLHERGMAMDIDEAQANELDKLGLFQKYGFYRPMMTKAPGKKYEPWHIQMQDAERRAEAIAAKEDPFSKYGTAEYGTANAPDPFSKYGTPGAFPVSAKKETPIEGKSWWQTIGESAAKAFPDIKAGAKQVTADKPSQVYEGKIEKEVPITPDTLAEFSGPAGEMVGQAMDVPFIPLHMARDYVVKQAEKLGGPFTHRPEMSFGDLVKSMLGKEARGEEPPTMAEVAGGAAELLAFPSYTKGLVKGGEFLGDIGKMSFYKYAPDMVFKPTAKGGLPYKPLSEGEWARLSPEAKEAMIKERLTPEKPMTAPPEEKPVVAPEPVAEVKPTPEPTPTPEPQPAAKEPRITDVIDEKKKELAQAKKEGLKGKTERLEKEVKNWEKLNEPTQKIPGVLSSYESSVSGLTREHRITQDPDGKWRVEFRDGGGEWNVIGGFVDEQSAKFDVARSLTLAKLRGEDVSITDKTLQKMVDKKMESELDAQKRGKIEEEENRKLAEQKRKEEIKQIELNRKYFEKLEKSTKSMKGKKGDYDIVTGEGRIKQSGLIYDNFAIGTREVYKGKKEYVLTHLKTGLSPGKFSNIKDAKLVVYRLNTELKGQWDWSDEKNIPPIVKEQAPKIIGQITGGFAPPEYGKGEAKLYSGGPETTQFVNKAFVNIKKSGAEAAKAVKEIHSSIREDLGITGNERSKMILEGYMGKRRASHQMSKAALQKWQEELEVMSKQEQMLEAAKYQQGRIDEVKPELQPLFKVIKELEDKKYSDINALKGRQLNYRENYIRGGVFDNYGDPRVTENQTNFLKGQEFDNYLDLDEQGRPFKSQAKFDDNGNVIEINRTGNGVGEAAPGMSSPAPGVSMPRGRTLTGGRSYFKGKVFPSWAEAMMVGYNPKHGLLDLMLFDLGQKDHYIYGMKAWKQARNEGLVQFFNPGAQPPGWVQINDPLGKVTIPYITKDEQASLVRKMAFAPKDVAKVWNNFLGEGLKGRPWYDRTRAVLDVSRKAGVAFSPFHMKVTLNTDISNGIGQHGSKALGAMFTGNPGEALAHAKKLGKSISGVRTVKGMMEAGKITRDFYDKSLSGDLKVGVDEYIAVGGSMPDAETVRPMAKNMAKAMKEAGREFGDAHVIRSIDKAADASAMPIMQYMVPRAKLMSFLEKRSWVLPEWQAKWEGQTDSPEAQMDWLRRLREIRQFDDSMYGQVAYDNFHFPRNVKDALFFLIKYPGWNLGSGRWILGNIKGAYQGLRQLGGGQPMGGFQKQALKFTAGLIIKTVIFNSLLYYLIHGKTPDDPKEIITKGVWTGGYNRDGSKEYVRDADYMRDLIGVTSDPFATVRHKLPSMTSLPFQLMKNEDYFGGKIISPGEPSRWPKEIAKAIGKEFVPYSFQQGYQGRNLWGQYGQLAGYTLSPASVARTPLETVVAEHFATRAPRGETPAKREEYEKRMSVEDLGRAGKMDEMNAQLKQMRKDHVITKLQEKNIRKRVADVRSFRFNQLPIDVAVTAWNKGSDEEKAFYAPILIRKINNIRDRNPQKYKEVKGFKEEAKRYKKGKPEYSLTEMEMIQ